MSRRALMSGCDGREDGTDPNLHCPSMAAVKRFVVAETSMLPALAPGDGVVAWRSRRVRRGQIRCFEHPHRPGFWLIKRVGDVRGEMFVSVSDHDAPGVVDSRRFGPVAIAGSYRVIVRIPSRFLRSRHGDLPVS